MLLHTLTKKLADINTFLQITGGTTAQLVQNYGAKAGGSYANTAQMKKRENIILIKIA